MIIINLINGRALACRGGLGLGFWRTILVTLRLPTRFQSFTSDEIFLVKPGGVSHYSFITDEEAAARRKASEEAQEKQGRVVQVPGMSIPRRRN